MITVQGLIRKHTELILHGSYIDWKLIPFKMDSFCTCTCITLFLSSWKHLSDSLVRISNSLSIALYSLVSSPQNSSLSKFFSFSKFRDKDVTGSLILHLQRSVLVEYCDLKNCPAGLAEETFAALLWWICHLPDLHSDYCITSQRLLSVCKWKCQLIVFYSILMLWNTFVIGKTISITSVFSAYFGVLFPFDAKQGSSL